METEEREDESQNLTANIKAEAADDTSGHTCGVCGRSFPLLSSLSQHMRRHTREKPYKCPYCEHRTAQKGRLKAHIRSHKLGLFSLDLTDDKGGAGAGEQKGDPEAPDPPNRVSASDNAQDVATKAKKKGTKKKAKGKDAMALGDGADDGSCTCSICGQVFPQVLLLKSHMKRHRNSQDHGCRICGRRFRQAWFLQSHMRIHRVKAQLRGGESNEPPATINGVPQDPASLANEECLFELCAGCGNFFKDRKTLRTHEKLHKPSHGRTAPPPPEGGDPSELHAAKRQFLESLSLTRAGPRETSEDWSAGRRIPELDPICSYQAWQLATRGRLLEATEKCLGWEERLADAEVAFDTEKGEYVPLKQEKKRKQSDTSSIKKTKGEPGAEHLSNGLTHAKGGDKRISQKDRILLNGLGHAFYEALQTKKAKDGHLTPKRSNSSRSQDQEDKKTHFCEHCDFHTVEASLLKSHLQRQHQDVLGPHSKLGMTVDNSNQSGSKASRYMDYLRNRSLLLSQPYWNPYTCTPGPASVASHIKTEKSNGAEVKGQGHTTDAGSLLNLSSLPVSEGEASVTHPKKTEGLVRHQCPYCSHTTNYPEVLWIHQRVAHRVDGSSSMAPKWAPCMHSNKSLKAAGAQWRRTGPPPFLEGKDCPALPAPRTQRTQPPGLTTSSSTSSKHSAPKTQPGVPKSKPQPKDSRPSDGTQASGKTGPLAQKKSAEHNRAQKVGSKGSGTRATSSSSILPGKGSSSLRPTDSPKHRGHRAPVEANFPQEGLGFMLARNHGGASSNVSADRPHSRRPSCDSSSGPKGPDLWAAMNMWGHKAYMEPVRFAQVKNETTGDVPMDILSLLKNYSPHDLAAVYQHWGFVDPRIDPQAMLQLNGNFGKEVHSTTEASKQVNSRSTSSSGSLHKGT